MSESLSTDVLIVGGGVAGLWLNARLRRLGYSTLLVDKGVLGGGQSAKSQGIIHGGTKYAPVSYTHLTLPTNREV